MNWLAHLRLAPAAPLVRLGNLCGDFVRGIELADLRPEIRLGIEQHRAVDRFVDDHAVTKRSAGRLRPNRFAGVLVDVFYDHFLARDWDVLGDGRELTTFVDEVHDQLAEHAELLPPRLRQILPVMRTEGWLSSYGELAGIDAILRRMAGRGRRRVVLLDGSALLREHYAELDGDFRALWPELAAAALAIGSSTDGE